MGETSQAAINKDFLDAQIKAACGSAKGIEGVCKWSRSIETKIKFDRKSFEQKHPDLFKEHLLPAAAPGLRVSVKPHVRLPGKLERQRGSLEKVSSPIGG